MLDLDEEYDVRAIFLCLFSLTEVTQHPAVGGEVLPGTGFVVQCIASSAVTHNPLERGRGEGGGGGEMITPCKSDVFLSKVY